MSPTSLPPSSTTRLLRWLLSTRLACQPQLLTNCNPWRNRDIKVIANGCLSWDGILGHQFKKRLESFAPCYSNSPFYWRILRKTILFSGFQNPYKKICKTRKLESVLEKHFVERKNVGRKQDKTRVWDDFSLCPKTSTKNTIKNSISGVDPAK